uniref:oleoyl-[acyl-carrier-protein] hydrolase n=1 Tax=Meloidogyne javanica TaxID=6303 RepID=A0A915LTE4_MELJA
MTGYAFDYLELNPSKEEMLVPFNLITTKNKGNEKITVDGENKKIKEKQENLNVKLEGGGLTKKELTEIVVKTWNDYMPFASGEAEGEKNFILGSAILYRHLSGILPLWANVVGVQYAFEADSLINKASSLGELAKYYAEKIEDYTKETPSLLIGHSLGGVLAYEIAHILNKKYLNCSSNLRVPLIILFDSWAVGQEFICPKKAKQFVLDRFHHFSIHQRNSLSIGAEKLAGFLRTHKFISNIELSPEIWLFTAEKKIKLIFSDYIGGSLDEGWACLTKRLNLIKCEDVDHDSILDLDCLKKRSKILEELSRSVPETHWQEYLTVPEPDWSHHRDFTSKQSLDLFVRERIVEGWVKHPRLKSTSKKRLDLTIKIHYLCCKFYYRGCRSLMKIEEEDGPDGFTTTSLVGRIEHSSHPIIDYKAKEAYVDAL